MGKNSHSKYAMMTIDSLRAVSCLQASIYSVASSEHIQECSRQAQCLQGQPAKWVQYASHHDVAAAEQLTRCQ